MARDNFKTWFSLSFFWSKENLSVTEQKYLVKRQNLNKDACKQELFLPKYFCRVLLTKAFFSLERTQWVCHCIQQWGNLYSTYLTNSGQSASSVRTSHVHVLLVGKPTLAACMWNTSKTKILCAVGWKRSQTRHFSDVPRGQTRDNLIVTLLFLIQNRLHPT